MLTGEQMSTIFVLLNGVRLVVELQALQPVLLQVITRICLHKT